MSSTRVLSAFAGLVVSSMPALAADDNLAVIEQIGLDNTGLINQLGAANQAGSDLDPLLQEGAYNALTINQIGTLNSVGLEGSGLDQIGDSATPTVFNIISIDQLSDNNAVGSIRQVARGVIPEGANRLFLQQGDAGLGDDNRIALVIQEQLDGMPGQIATILQSGQQNNLDLVEQRSVTSAEFSENTITASFIGSYNGRGDLTGPALASRAVTNSLVQRIGYDAQGANGNEMSMLVSGDHNRFGIFQGGRANTVGLVTIIGSSNQIGLRQDGLENDITVSAIQGDSNRIGIGQIGTNRAFLTLVGYSSNNDVLGLQEGINDLAFQVDGISNTITADQGYHSGLGGENFADINIAGDLNQVDLLQHGSNEAFIAVEGDLNNAPNLAFSGDAAFGLDVGSFSQFGMNNYLQTTIVGDMNAMAIAQTGDGNSISAALTGNLNQAAIIQAGDANMSYVVQSGNNNNAGIFQ